MLKTNANTIEKIIKVLTLEEINRYCEKLDAEAEVSRPQKLVVGGEAFSGSDKPSSSPKPKVDEEKAKILPFGKQKTDLEQNPQKFDEEVEEATEDTKGIPETELEQAGIISAEKIRDLERKKKKQKEAKMESASVFLIRERQKMRTSQAKLVEQAAIKNYISNSQVSKSVKFTQDDIDDINEDEDTGSYSAQSSGILLNKKQS